MSTTSNAETLTDAQLLLLGLVAEMPRHGYELEQEIERRGMREWTQIGFSSVYFVLGKLEEAQLVRADTPTTPKARKTFSITDSGRRALADRTSAALREHRACYSSLLLGMIHWPALAHHDAVTALATRREAVDAERARLADVRAEQQPLPDHVEAIFDYSLGQLRAEAAWIERTLAYMQTKPLLD